MTSILANPVMDNVAAGNVSIQQTTTTTTINQSSQKAIINWQSFNIGASEQTHFQQPNDGVTLNRINPTQGASQIYGQLTATGQIILVNPAGIYFGPSAYVNVGGLIASTANISDKDFLNGYYHFANAAGDNGAVVNQGTIIAAEHGLVALIGGAVRNDGMINAKLGHAVLASGDGFTLTFANNELVSFSVDSESTTRAKDQKGNEMADGVKNTGAINADGGHVIISAKAAQGVLDHAINLEGLVNAQSVSVSHGTIILSASPNTGKVRVAAKVNVSGKKAGEKGGNITVTGKNILLDSGTELNASGDSGAGNILIGGDYQGSGSLPHANAVVMMPDAKIIADALSNGNGGKIILWSDNYTNVNGLISARGGSSSGDGGLIETSSKNILSVGNLLIDTTAENGKTGEWLLDPYDVTISLSADQGGSFDGGTPNIFTPTATANILNTTLNTNLSTSNVVINTTGAGADAGNVNITAPVSWSSGNNLTINADGNISSTSGGTITASGGGILTLNTGSGSGTISGVIGGTGLQLIKSGSGTLVLAAANTYTGQTSITGGVLSINSIGDAGTDTAIGNSSTAINLGAGTLQYTGSGHSSARAITLTASGGTIDASGAGTLTLSGGVTGNTFGLVLTGTGSGTQSGVIGTTTGTVTKNGTGTWTLSGANTFSGGVTILNGTIVKSTSSSALGSGTLTLGDSSGGSNNATLLVSTNGLTTANPIVLASNTTGTLKVGTSGAGVSTTFSGGVTGTNNFTIDHTATSSSTITFSTVGLNNSGSITHTGTSTGSVLINSTIGALVTSIVQSATNAGMTINGALTVNASGKTFISNINTNALASLQVGNSISGTGNLVIQNNGALANGVLFFGGTINNAGTITNIGNGGQAQIISSIGANVTGIIQNGTALQLNGNNSYTGATSILKGTLSLSSANALPAGSTVTIGNSAGGNNAATLSVSVTSTIASPIILASNTTGTLTIGITSTNTTNFTGGVTGSNNLRLDTGLTTGTLNFSGAALNNAGTITHIGSGTGTTTISSAIGSNVTSITQGAANKALVISGLINVNAGGTTLTNTSIQSFIASGGITGTGNLTLINTSIQANGLTLSTNAVNNTGTITNASTNTGSVLISSNIGSNVTNVIQNSTNSKLILSGNNTYTGNTNITLGTLQMGSANAIPTGASTGNVSLSGVLDVNGFNLSMNGLSGAGTINNVSAGGTTTVTVGNNNQTSTFSGLILNSTGSISLIKTGSGTLTLSNSGSSYSNGTSINGGVLSVSSLPSAAGNSIIGTGNLSINNTASLSYTGATGSFNRAVTIGASGGTIQTTNASANTLTLTGGITANGDVTFDTTGAGPTNITLTTTGITGAGNVIKTGNGILTFAVDNTYNGTTTISNGTLNIGNGGTTGTLGSGSVTDNAVLAFNRSDSITIGNVISGTGSLTQLGSGTTILTGNNSYGTTTISAGTLQIGIGSTTGTLGSGSVTDNAVLAFNRSDSITIGNVISGTGSLTQLGSGTTILTGNNSYGTTTISAGTLQIGNGSTTGTLGSGSVTDNAVLAFNRSDSITIGNVISGTGSLTQLGSGTTILTGNNSYGATTISAGTLQVGNGGTSGTLGTGNITNNSALIFNRSDAISYASVISGTGSLTQAGSGMLTLSGASTYTGVTSITDGVLSINSIGDSGSNTAIGNSSTAINLGAGTLQYTGSGHTSSRAITLTASGGTIDASGSGTLTLSGGISGMNNNLVLTGSGIGIESGAITNTNATLTKNGSGKWTLGSTLNNYDGTIITEGTLAVSADTNLGAVPSSLAAANIQIGGGSILETTATFTMNGLRGITLNTDGGTIQSTSGTVTLAGPIDGANSLTLDGTGSIILTGNIGSNTPLTSLETSATLGSLKLNNSAITTSGTQIYHGEFSLGSSNNLTMNAGDTITLNAVNWTGSNTLQLMSATNIHFNNVISAVNGTLKISGSDISSGANGYFNIHNLDMSGLNKESTVNMAGFNNGLLYSEGIWKGAFNINNNGTITGNAAYNNYLYPLNADYAFLIRTGPRSGYFTDPFIFMNYIVPELPPTRPTASNASVSAINTGSYQSNATASNVPNNQNSQYINNPQWLLLRDNDFIVLSNLERPVMLQTGKFNRIGNNTLILLPISPYRSYTVDITNLTMDSQT